MEYFDVLNEWGEFGYESLIREVKVYTTYQLKGEVI